MKYVLITWSECIEERTFLNNIDPDNRRVTCSITGSPWVVGHEYNISPEDVTAFILTFQPHPCKTVDAYLPSFIFTNNYNII